MLVVRRLRLNRVCLPGQLPGPVFPGTTLTFSNSHKLQMLGLIGNYQPGKPVKSVLGQSFLTCRQMWCQKVHSLEQFKWQLTKGNLIN